MFPSETLRKACNTFVSAYMRVEEVPHRNTEGEVTTGKTVEKTETGTE